jgi:MFS family permease
MPFDEPGSRHSHQGAPEISAPLDSRTSRRNALYLGIDLAMFMAALGLLGHSTIVPLFISKISSDPLAIGLLATAFQLGWLPQIFVAGYVERSQRKLPLLIRYTVLERIPSLGLTLCALASISTTNGEFLVPVPVLLGAVYLCRFFQSVASGLSVPPWMDVIARVVPGNRRGRFMGNWTMIGRALGVGTAALTALLLDWFPFPYNFAACFGLASVILLVGMVPILLIKEPPGPPARAAAPFHRQMAEMATTLRADLPFRRFVSGLALVSFGTMATGFLMAYAVLSLGASDEIAAWYTVMLLAASVLANSALGWLADRHGFSAVGQVSALAGAGLSILAMLANQPLWLLASFAFVGIGQAGSQLAIETGPMEFAPVDRRPSYVALCFGLVSLAGAVAPLVGGVIVSQLGYHALFAASALFSISGGVALHAHRPPLIRGA